MKKLIRRLRRGLLTVLLVMIILVLVINLPIINFNDTVSENDYSNWMSETVSDDKLVKDIAMLGAHDTFSNEINVFSKIDPYETNGIMQGATGVLVKGFIVKQAVCQVNDVTKLLQSGVRYLDVRLSYSDGKWYTKHNYISSDFAQVAPMITNFLANNNGEFLIMDFQHINGVDYENQDDYETFISMLDEYGLLDYAYIVNDLATLTYGDITDNGANSKIIIISKFVDSNSEIMYYYDSIRSNWADSDDFDYVLNFIESEASSLAVEDKNGKFRVMQAVTTMQMTGAGIINALTSWSLIERAKDFNNFLIETESFYEMIEELPIIMVDYADTNKHEFNDRIMSMIINYNLD